MPVRIGMAGNMGAGKTTVGREFERLGIPVYYADRRAKELMQTDGELRERLVADFGTQSYDATGRLNRPYLASRVFSDPVALGRLNGYVHPVVARDAEAWHGRQTAPYTLHEAAILLEIGSASSYDAMVVVYCPLSVRRRRVMLRDGITEQQFDDRASKQWPDDRKNAAADVLIRNDGIELILPQVLRAHRRFTADFAP